VKNLDLSIVSGFRKFITPNLPPTFKSRHIHGFSGSISEEELLTCDRPAELPRATFPEEWAEAKAQSNIPLPESAPDPVAAAQSVPDSRCSSF
jgi:hypothetical protein